jgi:hypothetical protein
LKQDPLCASVKLLPIVFLNRAIKNALFITPN